MGIIDLVASFSSGACYAGKGHCELLIELLSDLWSKSMVYASLDILIRLQSTVLLLVLLCNHEIFDLVSI